MRNICLSMSKYPLGSNFGGTGDSGEDWGFRVRIEKRVLGLWYFTFLTYVFLCQRGNGFRVGIGFLKSFTC